MGPRPELGPTPRPRESAGRGVSSSADGAGARDSSPPEISTAAAASRPPVPVLKLTPVLSNAAAAATEGDARADSSAPDMALARGARRGLPPTAPHSAAAAAAAASQRPRTEAATTTADRRTPPTKPPVHMAPPLMDTSELDSLMSARGAPAQPATTAAAKVAAKSSTDGRGVAGASSDSDGLPPPSPRDPSAYGAAAGERTVLPIRLASKVTMVLGTLRVPPDAIRAAVARGEVHVHDPKVHGSTPSQNSGRSVTVDTLRAIRTIMPAPADLDAVRATYVVAGANPARASPADRFFLEMSRVPRAASKVDALMFRALFPAATEALHGACGVLRAAAQQATASEQLSRLLDIVLALGNILNRDKSPAGPAPAAAAAAAADHPAYKLGSLTTLAEMKADAKSSSSSTTKGSSGGATLLHYLAKTVEAKSPELLTFAASLDTLRDAVVGPSLAHLESTLGDLRTGLGKLETECEACGDESSGGGGDDEAAFAAALAPFRVAAADELSHVTQLAAETSSAAARLLTHFGPAPPGTTPDAVLRTLQAFTAAFSKATTDNARAKQKKAAAAERAVAAAATLTSVKE